MARLARPCIGLALSMLAALPGCKLVETEALRARAEAAEADVAPGLDWDAQILPFAREAAVPVPALRAALAAEGFEAAGTRLGRREGGEGTPFTFIARVQGPIVEADTESRAATAGVDTDGDGAADVTVQLGPVIRGTALRDGLPFVSFTDSQNQIAFAGLARTLNAEANERALAALPRDALLGGTLDAVGAATLRGADDPILLTPIELSFEAPS